MALHSPTQPLAQAVVSGREATIWACSSPRSAADMEPVKRCSYLDAIPEELVLTILELCEIKELLACQSTCRILRDVISNSASLCYKLALCKHGMCDGTQGGMSKAEKLGLLTAYVTAWGEIDSAIPQEVELFAGLGYPLDISGNILVFYKPMAQNKIPGPHRELLVCRTPSAIRRIELAHWVLIVPFGITDICIDASQDLLIYFLGSMSHIRSLSSGKTHPSVEHSGSFALHRDDSNRKDINYSRICGDYIAARVDFGHISVWNWKTGEHVSHRSPDAATPFDFLDEHRIMYVESQHDRHYICVYDFRDVPPSAASGGVQCLHPVGHKLQRLELPPLPPYQLPWHVELCGNTLPVRTGSALAAPFYADPHERLITVRATNSSIQGESAHHVHVFRLSTSATLLQYFAARRDNAGIVSWPAWCGAVHATRDRASPLAIKSSMLTCGMWAISYPPDGGKGMIDVDCYLPRRGRVRQSVKVPQGLVQDEEGFLDVPWEGGSRRVRCVPGVLSVLSEDGILFFTIGLEATRSGILRAFWYIF
ncbi:hypothetical protein EDB83DRAFT_1990156 [Lactarius deliciosus]|nr:hypothetical protein EDB83DRAFT_1990156 [Lactarius deliciosus]